MVLAHLQFLTKSIATQYDIVYVIYAGAAPGLSSYYLSDALFPNVKFILFDPQPFTITGQEITTTNDTFINNIKDSYNRIFICREYFTNDTAYILKDKFTNVLFISDVRCHPISSKFPSDLDVLNCNAMQFNWINILKPFMSSVKFRQPFYNDTSVDIYDDTYDSFSIAKQFGIDFIEDYKSKQCTYLNGTFYLQAWSRPTSSETRLCINDISLCNINITTYENSMYHYNTNQRTLSIFDNGICGDCALEKHIILEYYNKYNTYTPDNIKVQLNILFKNIH
jgi:hypothetical protein